MVIAFCSLPNKVQGGEAFLINDVMHDSVRERHGTNKTPSPLTAKETVLLYYDVYFGNQSP